MTKIRISSAIIGILILIFLLLMPKYIFGAALLLITLIALKEFFGVTKVSSRSFRLIGYLFSIPILFLYNYPNIFYYSLYLLLIGSFILVMLDYKNRKIEDVYITFLGTIIVSFFISHIFKIYNLEYGNLFIWLIFLCAWSTDTFAYFIGKKFGKHKFSAISPKKSVEGSVAGLISCIIIILLFGYYINITYNLTFSLIDYFIIGIIGGTISQIGDLAASLLKRSADAKDFGTIIPGHGGILDRFDSILFLAPAIYYYLHFFMLSP